jgi:phenylacetate-CoA ligase
MRYVPDVLVSVYDRAPVWTRSAASTVYGLIKRWKESGPLFQRYLTELEESQWWTRERLAALQADRLRALVRHAAETVPYYGKLFAEYGILASQIQTPDDLSRLPLLSKETVRREGRNLISGRSSRKNLQPESTSGTTGKPLTVWLDQQAYLAARAAQWLHHRWAGYTHREWIGIIAGYNVIPEHRQRPPVWTINRGGRQVHFSTRHLRPPLMSAMAAEMRMRKIRFLLGYPSAIGLFARHLLAQGESLPLHAVFLSSEPIYQWQTEAMEKAFGAPLFNYYGQAEKVLTAASCGSGLDMHLHAELSIAEFADHPAFEGRRLLVGTSLLNYGMPLIRYELEDVTLEVAGPCPCGRAHPRIGPVETHSDDFIVRSDGSMIPPSLLYIPFQRVSGVTSAQIVQEDVERITVNLLVDPAFTPEEEKRLVRALVMTLGPGVNISFKRVAEIPRTSSGKFRFVVSRVSHEVLHG